MLIAIPTMGSVHTLLASWLINQVRNGHEVIFTNQVSPHSKARNVIVEQFLKSTHTHLLMIDSDTVPPDDAMVNLNNTLNIGAEVVTGVTPILFRDKVRVNVYLKPADVENPLCLSDIPKSRFPVAGCGASFLCVSREVLEKIERPHFKSIEFDNGNLCSEDLYFSEQVANAGHQIICNPRIVCQHYKTVAI